MYAFNYHRVSSLDEAASLAKAEDAKLLSGGMTLLPAMKTRLAAPSDLIDLAHIAAHKGISVSGRTVTIKGGTTHHEVATSDAIKAVCPGFCELAGLIGDPAVRYRGTIGGSIANNDPAADYPAALMALEATVTTNSRELAAAEFFTGLFETALEEGEIVTAVTFTAPEKAGYAKFRNPASRYAITGVFVANGTNGVRAAVAGAGGSGVFRSNEIETALQRSFDAASLEGVSVPSGRLMSDMHASAEYRAALIVVMAKRALAAANGR